MCPRMMRVYCNSINLKIHQLRSSETLIEISCAYVYAFTCMGECVMCI